MPNTRQPTPMPSTTSEVNHIHLVAPDEADGVKAKPGKRERKHQRDQVRRLDAWEQYRALWDGVDFKRQLLNMGDKKVRFALVIMGAANAVLFVVMSRDPMLRLLPDVARIGIALLLVIYAITTFMFMKHAIEALRPAPEAINEDAGEWEQRELAKGLLDQSRHVGLIIRGPLANLAFDDERRLWSQARVSDVNAELILFNRASSVLLWRQSAQLRKVYQDLKYLVSLTAVILALVIGTSVWSNPGVVSRLTPFKSQDAGKSAVGSGR
ncbi:MAG: hypothetical protein U0132_18800 [Gemmatimonadaceae bacterium]